MSTPTEILTRWLDTLPEKPADSASRPQKQSYSTEMSNALAKALGESLRELGCKTALPKPTPAGTSGGERRLAGGIGAKKVDVSWATEESGLLLGISIKTINFRDGTSKNFQKNLTNRRGDMLFEAVTLHRRFPYAVLGGLLFFDHEARTDATAKRKSTFENSQSRLKIFTGRQDPASREEQFEGLYIGLVNASPTGSQFSLHEADDLSKQVTLEDALTQLLRLVAERNFDFYELGANNRLRKLSS